MQQPPKSTLFPYTTLFRSVDVVRLDAGKHEPVADTRLRALGEIAGVNEVPAVATVDRKSTRLNSSHSQISYAVLCLKKKKTLINKKIYLPTPPPSSTTK